MNHESQSKLLAAVAELSLRYPHWRFGQLIANVAGWGDREVWDVEDEQLLAAAMAHLQHLGAPEAKAQRESSQTVKA